MNNFEGLGLSQELNKSLAKMNYTTPTPIQAKAIPMAMEGHDILGSAQTGTGKTAAFSIPLVESLLRSPKGTALVLTPTRELAKQVLEVIHQLVGRETGIKTAFIIGGEQYGKQYAQLKAQPRIIVGTPGRINDHLERGTLKLHDTGFLVLDETDRMLDMGFGVQLDRIVKFLPAKRQTLMFSATLPQGIVKLSSQYLNNPQRISMGATNVVAKNIKQDVIRIEQGDKYKELSNQLEERKGSVIVFVKTKYNADKMAKNLRRDGFTSEALHGDLRQNKRERVMQNFRKQNFRILIATDIAARGLDVPHIEHVVNYDLPQVAEDFIHRMGRTARAGAEGSALSFVSAQEGRKWHAIEVLLDPEAAANDRGGRNNRNGGKPGRNPNARGGRPFQGKGKGNKKPYHGRNKRRDEEGTSENKGEGKKFYGKKPRFNSDSQNGEKKNFSKPRREGERPHGEGKPFKKRFSDEQSQSSDKRNGKRPENKNGNRDQKQEPRQGQAQNGQAAQGQEPRKHTQGKFVKGKKSFSNRGGNPFQGKGPNAKPNKRGNFKGPKKAAA